MGVPTITAARIYKGQLAGGSGEESVLAMERFPYVALSKVGACAKEESAAARCCVRPQPVQG